VLIQLAAGALLIFWVIRARFYASYESSELDRVSRVPVTILFLTVSLAIVGAHFHLSRPLFSVFAVRNFGRSWLSREIVFTVCFFLTMAALAGMQWFVPGRQRLKTWLGWLAILFGLATIYCMARIYMLPTQIFWNSSTEVFANYGTAFILGSVVLSAILLMDLNFAYEQDPENSRIHERDIARALGTLCLISALALILTLLVEISQITSLCVDCDESAKTSLELLFDLYQPLFVIRLALSILGVGWLIIHVARIAKNGDSPRHLIGPAYLASSMVLVGEVLGRFLFYAMHVRIGI
jgi:anaerobic dimethyl sulfoxide reductase subunit C (anchor subunit)